MIIVFIKKNIRYKNMVVIYDIYYFHGTKVCEHCAYDQPRTMHCVVHCLGHCSWTLYTNNVHGHCKKKKKKGPMEFGAPQNWPIM